MSLASAHVQKLCLNGSFGVGVVFDTMVVQPYNAEPSFLDQKSVKVSSC